jgi:hypothetical protein
MTYVYSTNKIGDTRLFTKYLEENSYVNNVSITFLESLTAEQQPQLENLVNQYTPRIIKSVQVPIFFNQITQTIYTNFSMHQWIPDINGSSYTFNIFASGKGTLKVRIFDKNACNVLVESDDITVDNFNFVTLQLLNEVTMPSDTTILEFQARCCTTGETITIQSCNLDFI